MSETAWRGLGTNVVRRLLEALRRRSSGRLWSIDLPPLAAGWREQTAAAVPDRLRARWTYLRGSSRRHLPRLLGSLGRNDLLVHDSAHTERNMSFELQRAWAHLAPGGALLADNISGNAAFTTSVDAPAPPPTPSLGLAASGETRRAVSS